MTLKVVTVIYVTLVLFFGLKYASNNRKEKRLTLKEKPIECKLCDKKFLQHNNINRHEGNKPFKRNLCEKEFRLIIVFLGFMKEKFEI